MTSSRVGPIAGRKVLLTHVVTVGLAACGGGTTPGIVVSDSLGIALVDLEWDAAPMRWAVAAAPAWVVGDEAATEYAFPLFRVRDVKELDDGSVVIAEGGTQQLVWIAPSAGAVERHGGPGDGPDEYGDLRVLLPEPGGRVYALDARRTRIVLVDREAGVVRSESTGEYSTRTGLASRGLVRSGTGVRYFANITGTPGGWIEGWSRGEGAIVQLDPVVDTIAFVPGAEAVMISQPGPMSYTTTLRLGATGAITGALEGVWIGDTRNSEVWQWTGPGVLRTVLRWRSQRDHDRVPPASAEAIERWVMSFEGPAREMWQTIATARPDSEPLPAFHALLTAPNGDLWIGRETSYVTGTSDYPSMEWLVVGAQLDTVGRIVTPRGFRPTQSQSGYLLGVYIDELGVETVRRYDVLDTAQ